MTLRGAAPSEEKKKTIRITRLHIEQDSGKMVHEKKCSMLDLNRAGSALMEIVSAPDMGTSDEAVAYVTKITRLLQFIGTCDADLSKGNLRMDVNVNVKRIQINDDGSTTTIEKTPRCEIKNLNSLVRMRDAIEYEVRRHADCLEKGKPVISETRGWNTHEKKTFSLREKEAVVDYRYYRDGDLPRVLLSQEDIDEVRASLLETPSEKVDRYCKKYGLPVFEAEALALEPITSKFFEDIVETKQGRSPQLACNWVLHELTGLLNAAGIWSLDKSPVSAAQIASILDAMADGSATGKLGKRILKEMFDKNDGVLAPEVMRRNSWDVLRDEKELLKIAQAVVDKDPEEAKNYRTGDENRKQRMLKHFMGSAMKLSDKRADPELIKKFIEQVLSNKKD